ncbi:hypothetical protein KPL70_026642 [Citrus sinensis]|nr:hypothetical protein KPL70_026642 [Citrus sinensis]
MDHLSQMVRAGHGDKHDPTGDEYRPGHRRVYAGKTTGVSDPFLVNTCLVRERRVIPTPVVQATVDNTNIYDLSSNPGTSPPFQVCTIVQLAQTHIFKEYLCWFESAWIAYRLKPMAIGEIFLTAFLKVLFDRLMSREVMHFARQHGIRSKLEKWRKTFLIYSEDVLDEFTTEVLARKLMGGHHAITGKVENLIPNCLVNLSPSAVKYNVGMKYKIKSITCSMGGIGKTTLARLVYNDKEVEGFNPKAWVCVSEDFDVLKITKAILESVTSSPSNLKDLNQVQIQLEKAIAGQKFLIVLDNVWSKNYGLWKTLKSPFMAGTPGSKIIVTTRSVDVALTLGPIDYYNLELLSDDDCWSIFEKHAFENRDASAHQNLELIHAKVVEKCKGLPQAAANLGGLLCCKQRDDEWQGILKSRIWDLSEESDILPVLRLSYHHLPSHLKRCFSYSAIFPKGYEFEEMELILLWMADGLIQQSEDNKQMEDLGHKYFRDLLSRSIFQKSCNNSSKFLMHDLVNDLAQWVSGETNFRLEDELKANKQPERFRRARHSSYVCGYSDDFHKYEIFPEVECLRTFLPMLKGLENATDLQDPTKAILSDKNDLECLVLECRYPFRAYSQSVLGMLKSHTSLKELTIKCYGGTRFPSWVGDPSFSNIVMITLESCTNCRSLPSLGLLCSLKALTIREMTELKIIGSEIYGDGCSKPFQSLETLCFRDLQEWELWDTIGKNEYVESFPLLRELSIVKCPKLSGRLPDHLPSLKKLVISECAQFEVSFASLPVLSDLSIDGCKGLVCGFPTSLTTLTIEDFNLYKPLIEWGLHKLTALRNLSIGGCLDAVSFPQEELGMMLPTSLTKLAIAKFPELKHLSSKGFRNLTSLDLLRIRNCPKLTSFPEVGLPSSLLQLYIDGCPLLKKQSKRDKGLEWTKIAHIPCVKIDDKFIYNEHEEG